MQLADLRNYLLKRLTLPLPGNDAHALMAHEERRQYFRNYTVPDNARISSVLFLLHEQNDSVHFPLIVRSSDGTVHSGQVGLPGGSFESDDNDLSATALRETEEEIGISRNEIELLGGLTPIYIPPSNFIVHPFVGIYPGLASFNPDTNEVARIVHFKLDDLLSKSSHPEKEVTLSSGRKLTTPAFVHEELIIWGATAMMMSELKVILQQ
jgi:8-oxo-dGTP pyrophosphatase MutT (NUDIX family)